MPILLATLGVGRGTWGHVARLITEEEWESIILISNEWVKEQFSPSKEVNWIIVNRRAGFEIIKEEIKGKLPDSEICVNLTSGTGKEHMALLAALKEAGKEFKIVTLTGDGTKYY